MQPRQIAAWQAMAEAQGVSVADMVREAMEYAASNMPDGYIKAKNEARLEALAAPMREAMAALARREAP